MLGLGLGLKLELGLGLGLGLVLGLGLWLGLSLGLGLGLGFKLGLGVKLGIGLRVRVGIRVKIRIRVRDKYNSSRYFRCYRCFWCYCLRFHSASVNLPCNLNGGLGSVRPQFCFQYDILQLIYTLWCVGTADSFVLKIRTFFSSWNKWTKQRPLYFRIPRVSHFGVLQSKTPRNSLQYTLSFPCGQTPPHHTLCNYN